MGKRTNSSGLVARVVALALALALTASVRAAPATPHPRLGPPPGRHVWEWPTDTSITDAQYGWTVFHALQIAGGLLVLGGGSAWVLLVRYDLRRTRRLKRHLDAPAAREVTP